MRAFGLRRQYLNRLVAMLVSPPPALPEDARAVARLTLADLDARIARVLARSGPSLDACTCAHLSDSRERIAQALDAPMIQR